MTQAQHRHAQMNLTARSIQHAKQLINLTNLLKALHQYGEQCITLIHVIHQQLGRQ